MKNSVIILIITAMSGLLAMLLAWQTGHREDFSCAGGGFAGLVVANGAMAFRRRATSNTSGDSVRSKDNASLLGTSIYLFVAIIAFACIGWMTGIAMPAPPLANTPRV